MERKINAKDRLILALDPDLNKIENLLKEKPAEEVRTEVKREAVSILDELEGEVGLVKVNYVAAMIPEIIGIIQERKIGVWRDWKHKDIPRTVKGFILGCIMDKIDMVTIHADGALEMVKYAVEGANMAKEIDWANDLTVLGVSVLTSIDKEALNKELEIPGEVMDKVIAYARLAEMGGVPGIVASAKESSELRKELKPETLIVTPAIKPEWAAPAADQKRITTPYQAIKGGSTHLVVGSAIIKAEKYGKTRAEAARAIVAEIDQALSDRGF